MLPRIEHEYFIECLFPCLLRREFLLFRPFEQAIPPGRRHLGLDNHLALAVARASVGALAPPSDGTVVFWKQLLALFTDDAPVEIIQLCVKLVDHVHHRLFSVLIFYFSALQDGTVLEPLLVDLVL